MKVNMKMYFELHALRYKESCFRTTMGGGSMAKYRLDSLLKNTLGEKYTPEAVETPRYRDL